MVKKNKSKLFLAGAYTFLTLLIVFPLTGHFFFPVTVEVQMSASQPDRCQLFYGSYRGFHESRSLIQPVSTDRFTTVTFSLPNTFINKIRLDPGFHSAYYEIKKITIIAGNESVSWAGEEISKNLTKNLIK